MVWLFVLIPLSFMAGVVIIGSIKEHYFSQGYLTSDCYDTHIVMTGLSVCERVSGMHRWL
jgi:hypothetical protein